LAYRAIDIHVPEGTHKEIVMKHAKAFFILGTVFFIILFVIAYKVHLLQHILIFCQDNGFWGSVLLGLIVFISAFVPFPGVYTISIASTGFLLGFTLGYFVAASASVLGSICAFISGRKLLHDWVERHIQSSPKFSAFNKAVSDGGFKVVVLFRVAPLPYGLVNLMMSATVVPLRSFIIANLIDSVRLSLEVYVGSQSRSLHDLLSSDQTSTPAHKIVLVVAAVGAVGATVFISLFVTKALKTTSTVEPMRAVDIEKEPLIEMTGQLDHDEDDTLVGTV